MTRELLHQSGSSEVGHPQTICCGEQESSTHRQKMHQPFTHPSMPSGTWQLRERLRLQFGHSLNHALVGEVFVQSEISSPLCSMLHCLLRPLRPFPTDVHVLHLLCQVDIEVLSAITPSKSAYSESGTAHSNSSFRRPSWCARRLSVAFPISE